MRSLLQTGLRFSLIGFVSVALTACELQRAQEASDARSAMVGLSKEQVLACMGSPANSAMVGNTEVWTFNSGNGRTDTVGSATAFGGLFSATAFGSSTSESRFCKVDVVMNNGRVSRINYSGPTGGLITEGEQCAFAIHNCMQPGAIQTSMASMPAVAQNTPSPVTMAEQKNEPAPPAQPVCSKADREMADSLRAQGYQYNASCL